MCYTVCTSYMVNIVCHPTCKYIYVRYKEVSVCYCTSTWQTLCVILHVCTSMLYIRRLMGVTVHTSYM